MFNKIKASLPPPVPEAAEEGNFKHSTKHFAKIDPTHSHIIQYESKYILGNEDSATKKNNVKFREMYAAPCQWRDPEHTSTSLLPHTPTP